MSNFKIVKKKGLMRAGVLKTAHGEVKTPVYMPVGTQGTVKALSPDDLRAAGAQIILGTIYSINQQSITIHFIFRLIGGYEITLCLKLTQKLKTLPASRLLVSEDLGKTLSIT
jgi:hypothetical protein